MAERKDAPAARPLLGTIGTIPRTVPLRAVFLSLAVFLSVKVQGPGTGRRKRGLDCGKKKKKGERGQASTMSGLSFTKGNEINIFSQGFAKSYFHVRCVIKSVHLLQLSHEESSRWKDCIGERLTTSSGVYTSRKWWRRKVWRASMLRLTLIRCSYIDISWINEQWAVFSLGGRNKLS